MLFLQALCFVLQIKKASHEPLEASLWHVPAQERQHGRLGPYGVAQVRRILFDDASEHSGNTEWGHSLTHRGIEHFRESAPARCICRNFVTHVWDNICCRCADGTRFDKRDADPEWADLIAERLSIPLHSEFAGDIQRPERNAFDTTCRTNRNDVS